MKRLAERLADETLRESFAGLFPLDDARNTRFSINYFTSIGMGQLTEGMREFLKNVQAKQVVVAAAAAAARRKEEDDESVSSYSSYSSYSSTRSSRSARSRRSRRSR